MTDRRKVKQMMTVWVAIGAFAIVLGYGAFRAQNLVEGPQLTVTSPQNGSSFDKPLIAISGTAKNISFLTLNGNKIFTDESGAYNEHILLSPGYNIVTIEAQDRFGRIVEKTLQLTL